MTLITTRHLTGYKWFIEDGGLLHSVYSVPRQTYSVTDWTEQGHCRGPFTLFQRLDFALLYGSVQGLLHEMPSAQLWEIEYQPATNINPERALWIGDTFLPQNCLPEGTVLAQAFRPIKLLWPVSAGNVDWWRAYARNVASMFALLPAE